MGKRYHCEYCDKTFMDNLGSRKRHLQSLNHIRNRKAHYDSLRDPSTVLANELEKRQPCREFLIDGNCKFAESCRFSHLTEEYKAELEFQILQAKKNRGGMIVRHNLHDWLRRYHTKNNPETKPEPEPVKKPEVPVYQLAPELQHIPNLPISVLPPPPSSLVGKMEEWG